jgi:pimeloyl-ACP methyl ester carboxylesterase
MTTLTQKLRDIFEVDQHPITPVSVQVGASDGFASEELVFAARDGEKIRGILTRPLRLRTPAPAILYIHAHGGRYDIGANELLDGRPALQGALGPVFAARGYVTLAIDLPAFGKRMTPGENSRTKALTWRGRCLAGQMLGELASAVSYLGGRQDVRPGSIGVFGISMGATLGYWLAAIDQRIVCAMHLCCFADFSKMVATGAHDLHGHYLTVPGLLDIAGNGEIAGLIAPRAQLICIGDRDPLTPPGAVDLALFQTRAAYSGAHASERLMVHREPDTGHEESPQMRQLVLEFAHRHLQL